MWSYFSKHPVQAFIYAFLIGYCLFVTVPITWLAFSSFKGASEFFTNPILPPETWKWSNYSVAWNTGVRDYFINSVIVTILSTLGVVVISSLAGYALARFDRSYNKFIYSMIILTYAIPGAGIVTPLYNLIDFLNLRDTLTGLVLPYIAFGVPFATIVQYSFFLDFPEEVEEAAQLDGCTTLQTFMFIVVPLSIPAIVTVAIYQIMSSWNEFLLATLFIDDEALKTLPVGLASFQGVWTADWGAITAAVMISVVPIAIFFVFTQKHFMNAFAGMSKG